MDITIGPLRIGDNHPCLVIAEVADNHGGRIDTAKKLIDEAKKSGADVVKFQIHLPDIEMIPGSIQMWDGPLYDILKRNLLSPDDHKTLKEYCDKVGIIYLCTPFCSAAADILQEIGVIAFKTGSGEMTNIPMQRHIARMGKPMIVSTGMCSLSEIDETVAALKEAKASFALTNCTSEYPPQYENINLPLIKVMHDRFGVPVGHSDHSPDMATSLGAVAMGAKIIEKHFTLDKNQKGPDHFISLTPPELAQMVDSIRKIEKAMTPKEKVVTPNEQVVRDWAYHSVVSAQDIATGVTLTLEMLTLKRPGTGIPAKELNKVIGKTTKSAIKKDTLLNWKDLD